MKFKAAKKAWAPALVVPKEVMDWKRYADPINQKLIERTKNSVWLDNSIPLEAHKPEQIIREPHKSYKWEVI